MYPTYAFRCERVRTGTDSRSAVEVPMLRQVVMRAGRGVRAVALPGGRATWAVAVGGLDTREGNSYDNWVRLGLYRFAADASAHTDWWRWEQVDEPGTVDVPNGCGVRTAPGFGGAPVGGYRGGFARLPDGRLRIVWTHDDTGRRLTAPLTENWSADRALPGRMRSPTFDRDPLVVPANGAFSDHTATFGIGYATGAPPPHPATRPEPRYAGTSVVASAGIVVRERVGDAARGRAAGSCLHWVRPATPCAGDPFPGPRVHHVAPFADGWRDTEWCRCAGGGHARPLLRVFTDAGEIRGWVGVEAFTRTDRSGRPDGDPGSSRFGLLDLVAPADPVSPA
jgi:hypothetical protein